MSYVFAVKKEDKPLVWVIRYVSPFDAKDYFTFPTISQALWWCKSIHGRREILLYKFDLDDLVEKDAVSIETDFKKFNAMSQYELGVYNSDENSDYGVNIFSISTVEKIFTLKEIQVNCARMIKMRNEILKDIHKFLTLKHSFQPEVLSNKDFQEDEVTFKNNTIIITDSLSKRVFNIDDLMKSETKIMALINNK